MSESTTRQRDINPWPHRLAMLLVCATFPLIWVGGLVTTYDAGMAVPDWPSTYGYNLFLYPWQTWIAGPWDLFIEHGHRLLGATVGLITIALVIVTWRSGERRWLRYLSLVALALVIVQGVLGGMRVVLNERVLAMIHGCVGPAFFALAVALSVFTSRLWRNASTPVQHPAAGLLQRLAVITAVLSYVQLVVGANLRHIPVGASTGTFQTVLYFHLLLAGVVTLHIILLAGLAMIVDRGTTKIARPALALLALVVVQLLLGGGTWVVNYSWPSGLPQPEFMAGFTVQSQSWLQSHIVTAHVATGSLIIATAVQLALRSLRTLRPAGSVASSSAGMKGAVA